jgi:NAD+ kinase
MTETKPAFNRIGILFHPKLPASLPLGEEIQDFLRERGFAPWLGSAWDEDEVRSEVGRLDLLITLGGDGTVLRAARMASQSGVPILALKVGRLGFLSEFEPAVWRERLPAILDGGFWIEERMMLHAEVQRGGDLLDSFEALNEVVASRGALARMIRLATHIDGGYMTTYAADGVIVATPTGSTAYALAVGGPILPPEVKNILVIPIAPHLSLDRAIVLSQGSSVRIEVSTDHRAMLTVDGQYEVGILDRDNVLVKASPNVARFVRTRERTYFYRSLMKRLTINHEERDET